MGELELALRGRERRRVKRAQERERKKAEATARKSNPVPRRKYMLPLLAVGAFGLSVSGIVYGMRNEPEPAVSLEQRLSYQDARSNPSRQAEYVKKIPEFIGLPDYLVGVEYSTKFKVKRESLEKSILRSGSHPAMVTSTLEDVPFKELGRKTLNVKTRIYPRAFEKARNEKEFLLFFRHELNQAKIIHKGFDSIPMDLFFYKNGNCEGKFATTLYNIACELESYRKDIFRGKKEGFDRSLINSLIRDYMTYQMQLKYIPGKSDPYAIGIHKKLEREFSPIVK
ncbi:hypothetical protein KY312_02325 [Candidatus Woesearchaeota archaeon]|nr:hypothetical protein [Candidatus Woesearchaeota archaeon]